MIEDKYIEKFYQILSENYDDKALLYKKATSYINGVIRNGGKINEFIYADYSNKKHFNQDSAIFHHQFMRYYVYIDIDLFKFMEERGMLVIPHKFIGTFHYNSNIVSHINENHTPIPLSEKDKEAYYDAFMCSVKFGVTEVLPFYFKSKAKNILLSNEETLIKDLSYYLYWHSYDDKNEEAVAWVICKYYEEKNINLMPKLIEKYCAIAHEKGSNLEEYGIDVINKITSIFDKYILEQNISLKEKTNKSLKI
jgi:hypothetical protein